MITTTLLCEEIEAVFNGRPILIDAEIVVQGEVTQEYRPSLTDPGEPAHFEGEIVGFHILRATDNGDEMELTLRVFATACLAVKRYTDAHEDRLLDLASEQVADEIEIADGADRDRADDAAIDRARESRGAGGEGHRC